MTKQEIEYVKTLNLSPKMEVLVKYPTYTDLWGFQYNWTNTDEGWYPMKKYDYLSRLDDIDFQRKNIKRFTELGYKGAFHLLLMIKENLKKYLWVIQKLHGQNFAIFNPSCGQFLYPERGLKLTFFDPLLLST